MKRLLFLILLVAGTANAQLVQSTLPSSPAPILVTPYNQQSSVLLVGKFTSAGQSVDDIAVTDSSANLHCFSNMGQGVFQGPSTSTTGISTTQDAYGGILTVAQNANFSGTDYIFLGSVSNTFVGQANNCTAAVAPLPISQTQPPYSAVVSIAPTSIQALLSSVIKTWLFEPPQGAGGSPYPGETAIAPLPPNIFPNQPSATALTFIQQPWAQPGGPGDVGQGVTVQLNGTTNDEPLSGEIYLGTMFPSGFVVVVTCTHNEVYLDEIFAAGNGSQPAISNLQAFSVPSPPVGAVVGNFFGNGYDIAIANGSEIDYFSYQAGGPSWSYNQTVQVSGKIFAIAHGNIISPSEDDVVVQTPSGITVSGSAGVSQLQPAASPNFSPPGGTFTSAQLVSITTASASTGANSSTQRTGPLRLRHQRNTQGRSRFPRPRRSRRLQRADRTFNPRLWPRSIRSAVLHLPHHPPLVLR